jgi:hypothetical protein
MSQLAAAPAILAHVMQDAIEAWELGDASVEFGFQRIAQLSVPFAVVDLLAVEMEAQSVRTVEQSYSIVVSGFFPFPETGNILLDKIAKADALIAKLITGPNYNELAYRPRVSEVSFEENDPPEEKVYEVHVLFECQVTEEHWPGANG